MRLYFELGLPIPLPEPTKLTLPEKAFEKIVLIIKLKYNVSLRNNTAFLEIIYSKFSDLEGDYLVLVKNNS